MAFPIGQNCKQDPISQGKEKLSAATCTPRYVEWGVSIPHLGNNYYLYIPHLPRLSNNYYLYIKEWMDRQKKID